MLSKETASLIPAIRNYLSGQPIVSAWLFGSCSRGDESAESDMDIMVTYDSNAGVSLFTIGKIISGLSEIVGKPVDLVEGSGLMPFAAESANRDKILIYERKNGLIPILEHYIEAFDQ